MGKVHSKFGKVRRLRVRRSHESNDPATSVKSFGSGTSGSRSSKRAQGQFLPHDEDEQERYALMHFIAKTVWDSRNFSSPVHDVLLAGGKVLDVGCGSGSFMLDTATSYPASKFVGVDVNPNYPTAIKPANVDFREGDVLAGLPFPADSFDLVFCRFMTTVVQEDEWPQVLADLARVCKPGGWVELASCDFHYHNAGPIAKEFTRYGNEYLIKNYGVNMIISSRFPEFFNATGCMGETHKELRKVPVGPHGNKLGNARLETIKWSMNSSKRALPPEEEAAHNSRIQAVLDELTAGSAYEKWYRIFAQKARGEDVP